MNRMTATEVGRSPVLRMRGLRKKNSLRIPFTQGLFVLRPALGDRLDDSQFGGLHLLRPTGKTVRGRRTGEVARHPESSEGAAQDLGSGPNRSFFGCRGLHGDCNELGPPRSICQLQKLTVRSRPRAKGMSG